MYYIIIIMGHNSPLNVEILASVLSDPHVSSLPFLIYGNDTYMAAWFCNIWLVLYLKVWSCFCEAL